MGRTAENAGAIHEEILLAVSALLEGRFQDDFLWIAVGLLDEKLDLHWRSLINHQCNYLKTHYCSDPKCGDAPCFSSKEGKCRFNGTKCEFSKNLFNLEVMTMTEGVASQGRLSLDYWQRCDEAPYVALDDGMIPGELGALTRQEVFKWIQDRNRDYKSHLHGKYEEAAHKCMPDSLGKRKGPASAALVPLVMSAGMSESVYVGAIVVCGARDKTALWRQLPTIKGLAVSLLDPHRLKYWLASNPWRTREEQLLRILTSNLTPDNAPFTRQRHEQDDVFYTNHADTFVKFGVQRSANFLKSLFHCGEVVSSGDSEYQLKDGAKGIKSDARPNLENYFFEVGELATFIREGWKIELAVDPVCHKRRITWPILPGILPILSVLGVYELISQQDGVSENCIKSFKLTISDSPDGQFVVWHFVRPEDKGLAGLFDALWSSSGGRHSRKLRQRLCLGFDSDRLVANLEPKAQHAARELLKDRASPCFGWLLTGANDNELRLFWRIPSSTPVATKIAYYNGYEPELPAWNSVHKASSEVTCVPSLHSLQTSIAIVHDEGTRKESETWTTRPPFLARHGVLVFFSTTRLGGRPRIVGNGQDACIICEVHRDNESGHLTADEWHQLIDWASALAGQQETNLQPIIADMPSVVRSILAPVSIVHLHALRVLCEGFLMAVPVRGGGKNSAAGKSKSWWQSAVAALSQFDIEARLRLNHPSLLDAWKAISSPEVGHTHECIRATKRTLDTLLKSNAAGVRHVNGESFTGRSTSSCDSDLSTHYQAILVFGEGAVASAWSNALRPFLRNGELKNVQALSEVRHWATQHNRRSLIVWVTDSDEPKLLRQGNAFLLTVRDTAKWEGSLLVVCSSSNHANDLLTFPLIANVKGQAFASVDVKVNDAIQIAQAIKLGQHDWQRVRTTFEQPRFLSKLEGSLKLAKSGNGVDAAKLFKEIYPIMKRRLAEIDQWSHKAFRLVKKVCDDYDRGDNAALPSSEILQQIVEELKPDQMWW